MTELQYFYILNDSGMKIARISLKKLRALVHKDRLRSFPDPNSNPIWICLGSNYENKKVKNKTKRYKERADSASSLFSIKSTASKRLMRKNAFIVASLKKMDKLLSLIKPQTDPRLYEFCWIDTANKVNPQSTFKSMYFAQKLHKYKQKKFNHLNRRLKLLSYDELMSVFREENYENLIRHVKHSLRHAQSDKEKIDAAVSVVRKNLKKLNLNESSDESVEDSEFGNFGASGESHGNLDFDAKSKIGTVASRLDSRKGRKNRRGGEVVVKNGNLRIRRGSHVVRTRPVNDLGG